MPMYVKETGKGVELKSALAFLKSSRVLIGIPQAASSRRGEITNAELAFIHTHGSPINRIPARPFLEPAIEETKEQLRETNSEEKKAQQERKKVLDIQENHTIN